MCDEKHYGPTAFADCFHFGPQDVARMKRMARHFMHGFMGSHIPFNIEDLGDSYMIIVPLAGRSKEEVKLSLINNNLNIKAEKPKIPERENLKKEPKGKESPHDCYIPFFRKGFSFIEVDMDIPLPSDVDTRTLISKMSNGLLKISIRKKPAEKIDISEN
jgi:HSP20 family molecular chaperone IbpA